MPGEIRGTATDFCSSVDEGGKRISGAAGTDIASAYIIINEWIADLRRFAPEALNAQVAGFTTQLTDVSKNLQLATISTNEDFKTAIVAVLTSSDGQAVNSYYQANCPKP